MTSLPSEKPEEYLCFATLVHSSILEEKIRGLKNIKIAATTTTTIIPRVVQFLLTLNA